MITKRFITLGVHTISVTDLVGFHVSSQERSTKESSFTYLNFSGHTIIVNGDHSEKIKTALERTGAIFG